MPFGLKQARRLTLMCCLCSLGVAVAMAQGQSSRRFAMAKLDAIGAGIYEVAVGAATDAVYVASTDTAGRRVFVLDPRTLAVRGTFDSERPLFGLAFNDKTRILYGTSTTTGSIVAIDVRTGRTVGTINSPGGIAAHVFRALVDQDANMVYVSIPEQSSRIWAIDGAALALKFEIPNTGGRSTGLALDKKRNRLFTCSIASSEIIEIDLGARRVVRRFPSGGLGTTHLEFDPETNRLFASHQRSGDVTVVDAASGALLGKVSTGDGALGLALDGARHRLYVTNRQAETVTVIDSRTLAVVASVKGGNYPNTVAIDARTGDAYVTFKSRAGSPDRVGRVAAVE